MAKDNLEDVVITDEPKKITEDELKTIQEFEQKMQNLQFMAGGVFLMNLDVEKRSMEVKEQYEALLAENKTNVDGLQEKYGQVSIDKNTGIIKPSPNANQ
tara:strand:- start:54 stop:353 length:300 start_codon:yes stop_codon:yes gene_type:complete